MTEREETLKSNSNMLLALDVGDKSYSLKNKIERVIELGGLIMTFRRSTIGNGFLSEAEASKVLDVLKFWDGMIKDSNEQELENEIIEKVQKALEKSGLSMIDVKAMMDADDE